jgi:hypothetical protein
VQNEKDIFKQERQEFNKEDMVLTSTMQQSKEALEYYMPPLVDHTNEMKPLGKVSTIKGFLQSCIKVVNDPSFIKIFQNIL